MPTFDPNPREKKNRVMGARKGPAKLGARGDVRRDPLLQEAGSKEDAGRNGDGAGSRGV